MDGTHDSDGRAYELKLSYQSISEYMSGDEESVSCR